MTRDEERLASEALYRETALEAEIDRLTADNQALRALNEIGDVAGRQNVRLKAAMQAASKMLKSPAAEYVPAMSEAWAVLDRALANEHLAREALANEQAQ